MRGQCGKLQWHYGCGGLTVVVTCPCISTAAQEWAKKSLEEDDDSSSDDDSSDDDGDKNMKA